MCLVFGPHFPGGTTPPECNRASATRGTGVGTPQERPLAELLWNDHDDEVSHQVVECKNVKNKHTAYSRAVPKPGDGSPFPLLLAPQVLVAAHAAIETPAVRSPAFPCTKTGCANLRSKVICTSRACLWIPTASCETSAGGVADTCQQACRVTGHRRPCTHLVFTDDSAVPTWKGNPSGHESLVP